MTSIPENSMLVLWNPDRETETRTWQVRQRMVQHMIQWLRPVLQFFLSAIDALRTLAGRAIARGQQQVVAARTEGDRQRFERAVRLGKAKRFDRAVRILEQIPQDSEVYDDCRSKLAEYRLYIGFGLQR